MLADSNGILDDDFDAAEASGIVEKAEENHRSILAWGMGARV
jgi:hypothetical protein